MDGCLNCYTEKEPHHSVKLAQYDASAIRQGDNYADSSGGHTAMVEESVAGEQIRWVYHYLKVWIPYAVALIYTTVRVPCMVKNKDVEGLGF